MEAKKDVILWDLIIRFSDQDHVKTLHAVPTSYDLYSDKFDFGHVNIYLTLKTIQRILADLE